MDQKDKKGEIIFEWESDEEKLKRWIKIPPKKRMQWLRKMHEFSQLVLTKEQKDIFWRLRERR